MNYFIFKIHSQILSIPVLTVVWSGWSSITSKINPIKAVTNLLQGAPLHPAIGQPARAAQHNIPLTGI